MGKQHKIIKYNLQDEAVQLKNMGYSNKDVAQKLSENHPEIEDIQNLSDVSVMRFYHNYKEGKIEDAVLAGGDPVGDFIDDYRKFMDDLQKKTDDIYNRAVKIADDVEATQSPDSIERIKSAELLIKSIDQLKKNAVAIVQFGDRRLPDIMNVNLKKEFHVRNMMMNCSRRLCPKCREELLKELEMMEDDNKK